MMEMYKEWFDNDCSYEDEEDLLADVQSYKVIPHLVYDEDAETIDVYLLSEDADEDFYELLGSMPVSLYEEKQSTAEASIFAYELIATVLFDKVYADGKDDTPLRVANWIDLDKQLPSFLETI